MSATPPRKHLVLLGAGPAHLQVLQSLARQGSANLSVSLVTPSPYYIDPAMLPAYVAGDYTQEQIRLPLAELIDASHVHWLAAHPLALDVDKRRVHLSCGDALPYDVLSVDLEPAPQRDVLEQHMPGVRQNAMFLHPLEGFVQLWPQVQALSQSRALQVAVLGHELPAVELALALADSLSSPHGSRVTLVTGSATDTLSAYPPALQRRLLAHLKTHNVTVLHDTCVGMDGRSLKLASGASLVCDAPVVASAGGPPNWLLQAGLQVDEASGQILINQRLQSESHRQIFIVPQPAPLDAGAVLATNLRTAINGGQLKNSAKRTQRLLVAHAGAGHAVAVWGPFGIEGREVWHWKDRRDRRQLAALLAL